MTKPNSFLELRHHLGSLSAPITAEEMLELWEALSTEEKTELRNRTDVSKINYWDHLDRKERLFVDD